MSSGQAQDSGSQASRGHTCPWAAGLEPDSLSLMASGTGLAFLGIKDEKVPPGLGLLYKQGAGLWQRMPQTPSEAPTLLMVLGLACGRPHRVGTLRAEERFASAFTALYDYRKSACTERAKPTPSRMTGA